MTDNVERFFPANAADDPDNVLLQAIGEYQDVLIIGWDKDGELDVRSSTYFADSGNVLWAVEAFKHSLLSGDYS